MKSRSWIKTMAVTALMSPRALLSPRSAFRKANSTPASLGAADSTASTISSIPLKVLATLTRVVQFLDENHSEEEGLYSKSGVGLERKELLRFCKNQRLPALSLYSPHSIASVIKEILSDLYEPLVPADISQQLLDVVSGGDVDEKTEHAVTEIFKQIPSSTREFLQVLLSHLNNVAVNGSSRMGVTNLALHIGIALVRPTEDKAILNSKNMMRRRKNIAEFFIRQAASLPYDCATELNIPAIPESVSTYVGDSDNMSSKQLHFVQVTWNAGESDFTPEQLEEMFGKFGEIENLGINDQGNRAIIAYASAAGAEAAERASIPYVHVRRRKPRQGEKRREYSSHSPERSRPRVESDATRTSETGRTGTERTKLQKEVTAHSRKFVDDTIIVEDIEDDQIEQVNAFSNRSNAALHIQAHEDDQISEKDGSSVVAKSVTNHELNEFSSAENLPNSEQATLEQQHASIQPSEPEQSSVPNQEEVKETLPSDQTNQTQYEVLYVDSSEIKTGLKANVLLTAAQNDNQTSLSDLNETRASEEVSTPEQDQHLSTKSELQERLVKPSISAEDLPETPPLTPTDKEKHEAPNTDFEDPESKHKTEKPFSVEGELLELISQSLEPPEVSTGNIIPTSDSANKNFTGDAASIKVLQSKLRDMEKVLSTSTAALSSKKLSNEFERAVLQLHKQILDMVAECLVLLGASDGEVSDKSINGTTSAEFLDFLEAQSKTQMKILEVEVRAGQELLRLHKTQYEKERLELEEEITTLRVGRMETERLCAELRTDLRKCRSELACHVANAADIQRQKSTLEEKLAASENQFHAKEIALAKLQAGYDKMERVAAEAQIRAEKYKQGDFVEESKDLRNQIGHTSSSADTDKRSTSVRVSEGFPHTTKLFSKLSKSPTSNGKLEDPWPPKKVLSDTPVISSRSSNVAALEVMKQQMARDIQEQIATTRAALREMEICSSSGKTLEEEEEELRQLQQQLAARSAEMDAAMKESRTKLKELLNPTTAASFDDNDEIESNQEPSIFDSTALVNGLIARAEKSTSCNSTRPPQHETTTRDDSSYSSIQNPFTDAPQQLSHYHRPAREAQSILYKKWTADRSRKMAQLASYRDQQVVLNAQNSMKAFQQSLAELRSQR